MVEIKETDVRATPSWLMSVFEDWFDPCPLTLNPKFDGLAIDWKDKTFVNPPYSKPLSWCEKAVEENKKGKTIALLVKLDTSTKWFKLLMENGGHLFYSGERLKFWSPVDNKEDASPFPSALIILEGVRST